MSKYLRPGLLALVTATAFGASSQSYAGPYVGASVGNAQIGLQDPDIQGLNIDIRDNDIGYKIYGGFDFILGGVEAGYIDFGSIGNDGSNIELKGFDAFGVLSMGIGPVEVFGKIGGFVWETNIHNVRGSYEESGFDPAFGAGASFSLGGLGVRAEYEYFNITDFDRVSMLSVGATFSLF